MKTDENADNWWEITKTLENWKFRKNLLFSCFQSWLCCHPFLCHRPSHLLCVSMFTPVPQSFLTSRAEGTNPSTSPPGRVSSREPTKKIKKIKKSKGAALLDFKNRKTDVRAKTENNKGREGGKREKWPINGRWHGGGRLVTVDKPTTGDDRGQAMTGGKANKRDVDSIKRTQRWRRPRERRWQGQGGDDVAGENFSRTG